MRSGSSAPARDKPGSEVDGPASGLSGPPRDSKVLRRAAQPDFEEASFFAGEGLRSFLVRMLKMLPAGSAAFQS